MGLQCHHFQPKQRQWMLEHTMWKLLKKAQNTHLKCEFWALFWYENSKIIFGAKIKIVHFPLIFLPWEILDLHSCVFFCAKIDDCNNFGAKVQIRQSIGRPEGIVPLCTSSPHPIWFIWPFGQFSVLTRFEHWPHVYQDMADQGGFIFKKS